MSTSPSDIAAGFAPELGITATRERDAKQAYAGSVELVMSEDRALLSRPESGIFKTEFILGWAGTLIIHGDCPDIILRSYSDQSGLEYLIRWAAQGGYDYIGSKAVAGQTKEFSWEEAQHQLSTDLLDRIRDHNEFYDDEKHVECIGALVENELERSDPRHALAELSEFIEQLGDEYSQDALFRELDGVVDCMDSYYEGHLGMIPAKNLIYAVAACKRAVAILDERRSP